MQDTHSAEIIILAAPSGAGKTTIKNELFKRVPELAFSVSATTRPQRSGEVEGVDYYFIDEVTFERGIAEGAFVEWEEVYSGRYYGTLISEVQRIAQLGKTPIFEVDVNGALRLKRRFGQAALSIFVMPPSLEVLTERLRKRGTENEADLQERIARGAFEIQHSSKFDYVVINDNLDVAIDNITATIQAFLRKDKQ